MKLPEQILPLIDGDWIVYMACSAIEYKLMKAWKEECDSADIEGYNPPPEPTPSFDETVKALEYTVSDIMRTLETSSTPFFFYTGKDNFRIELAKTKAYKGNRPKEKPFHYQNLKNYIEVNYMAVMADDIEADDLMSIWQTRILAWNGLGGFTQSCIVTVDKDLRQVDGWHYSPEGHNYGSWGPRYCDDSNTYIEPKNFDKISKGLVGSGYRFFYSQCITGDAVDNIPGLPRHGPAAALKILGGCETEVECYEAVRDAYRDVCLMADDYLLEQARLLYMIRRRNDDGSLEHWNPPVSTEFKGMGDEGC